MRTRWLVLVLVMVGACSSSSTPPIADLARGDLAAGDLPLVAEARVDLARRDLGRDGPRPPATWKTVTGAPQATRHTATLLQNGDVLVVGGLDHDGNELSAAHRYLAAQAQFVPAGNLAVARVHHTASLLPDGRVLVVGGYGAKSYLSSSEIYDPAKPAASAWSPGPEMLIAISEHAAVTLADGKVLLSGGWKNGFDSNGGLHLYDPQAGAFNLVLTILKVPRRRHTSTLLKNGKVLMAGGIQGTTSSMGNWIYLDSLEVYDPVAATTTAVTQPMSTQRLGHSASLLGDGRVLIAGGGCWNLCKGVLNDLDDLYDPATDGVFPLPHPGDTPLFHGASILDDGRVIVAGGTTTPTKVFAFTAGPPASWAALPALAAGRTLATATKLLDGTVLLVGGVIPDSGSTLLTTAERFFP